MQAVDADQERLAAAAEDFAKSRADRLRLAFRMAGRRALALPGARQDRRWAAR